MHHHRPSSTAPLAVSTPSGAPLTAAAVLDMIKTWEDLSETRRRDLASAVNAAVKAAGVPADAALLTPAALRTTLLIRSAMTLGITDARMSNVKSGLRAVLCRVGLIDDDDAPISSAWSELLELLSPQKRACFVAFARFCSSRQIAPVAVTSEVLAAFEEHLTTRTLCPRPRKRAGEVMGAWNRMCGSSPAWPTTKLSRGADPRQYILPLEAFPESFRTDLDAYGKRMASTALDDPFEMDDLDLDAPDEEGPSPLPRPLRPATITTRLGHCRWAASALVASGAATIDEITGLASLVTPLERVKRILRFLYDREGGKPSAGGGHVAEALRIIAKHHVGLPEKAVAQIKRWGKPVRLTYPGMTRKNEEAIRRAMEPAQETALLGLPGQLMRAARQPTVSPVRARSLAFRAVVIALLTYLPIRRKNIVELRLDRHLFCADPKRKRITAILIEGCETKTGAELTLPVSAPLAALIDEWIASFRSIGTSPGSLFLFPGLGSNEGPVTPQGLHAAVVEVTERYAGARLSPQQFRHLAAKRFLEVHPGHQEEVRQLLRHASLETTTRHYAGMQTEASLRRLDEIVQGRTRSLSRNAPRSKRRRGVRHGS